MYVQKQGGEDVLLRRLNNYLLCSIWENSREYT